MILFYYPEMACMDLRTIGMKLILIAKLAVAKTIK